MELESSSDRRADTPEKDPTPEQTVLESDFMDIEADLTRLSQKRVEMRKFLDRIAEKASLALECSVNWEKMEDSLKKREMEVYLKEKSVMERILELEKKEERLRKVEEREKKIEFLENSISMMLREKEEELETKQILECSLLRLVLEKEGEEAIDKVEEKRQEVKSRELEVREKEVSLLDETIKERLSALEKREEIFEANQKEKTKEMELKSMLLELKEKKLEEREKEIDLKEMELEERSKQAKTSKRSMIECTDIHPAKRHKRLVSEHMKDCVGKETDSTSSVEMSEANEEHIEVFVSKDGGMDEDPELLTCADSEFNDFEKTMNSFVVNEVWAIYDPVDDMPRLYGQIKKVNKFQCSLQVTWLEPKDQESVPMACGRFKKGKTETISHLTFSHEMHPMMHKRYIISLNPRKGETWALFRDWTNNPNQHKPPYRYDFVEILFDFDECYGIGVSYLGKVEGFSSVYNHAGKDGVVSFMIQPEEMHRFSHRVPSFRLNGEEKEGVPAGSFELDPAAIPDSTLNPKEVEESKGQIKCCG